jgi:hypothetical protein
MRKKVNECVTITVELTLCKPMEHLVFWALPQPFGEF